MKIDGITVIDANKPVRIVINVKDVEKGNIKDPGACAAAQACMRQLHATAARVHIARTYLKMDKKWVRYRTSTALRTEIVAFDRGGQFEPGEYTLEPLPPTDRASGRRQGSASAKRTGKKRKKAYHLVTDIRAHGANR